jgi:calmodulin
MEIKQGFEFKESTNNDLIKEELIRKIINGYNESSGLYDINEIVNQDKSKQKDLAKLKNNKTINNDEEEVLNAFKLIDKDGNGLISTTEFHYLLTQFGNNLREEDINDIINEADPDHDGYINYYEYVKKSVIKQN